MGLETSQERKQNVLSSVIRHYVATAKPVGSQVIAEEMDLSSATIRNVLLELENEGFLTHPHTSAGRIPEEQGYRFYVDRLMLARQLNLRERQMVEQEYEKSRDEVETLLNHTAKILSAVTHLAGLTLFPVPGQVSLSHFKLVAIDSRKVMVILVLEHGLVREELVRLDAPVQLKEVSQIIHLMNSRFSGWTLSRIREALLKEAETVKKAKLSVLETALCLIDGALQLKPAEIQLEGASHLVEQPEFKDSQKMERVVRLIESKGPLSRALERQWEKPGLTVEIGREFPDEALREFSFVHVPCFFRGQVVGALGVLGPTRMAYDRVTAVVDHLAKQLERAFTRNGESSHGGS